MARNFIILENFKYLLARLASFNDPAISYSSQGRKDLRGGARRIYRKDSHYAPEYSQFTTQPVPPVLNITYGNAKVECEQWNVTHNEFSDDNLKEKYPKPAASYRVLITSRDSLKKGSASRYYVSCTCMDFDTTFKERLVTDGYTLDDGTIPTSSGKKKTDSAICKHIYAVLSEYYGDIISQEAAPNPSPVVSGADISATSLSPAPATQDMSAKKADYEKAIRRTLKFLSNQMSNKVDSYKNSRAAQHYKKYKFMVKRYPTGWVIVFTNALLNPFRDKTRADKQEIVPILYWTSTGARPLGISSQNVYSKFFTKEELMNFIKAETREMEQAQATKILSVPYNKLTESIIDDEMSVSNVLCEVLSGV